MSHTGETQGRMRGDIKRSEHVLEAVGNKVGLTEAGREWIIGAFDPFHDRQLNVCGYPDSNGNASVCQEVTETFTVSVPPSVTTNWDCHIVNFPFLGSITSNTKPVAERYSASTDTSGGVVAGNFNNLGALVNGNTAIGGCQAYCFLNSANNIDIFQGTVVQQVGLSLPRGYIQNPYRVIGMAFEVYNTTPTLYKGGSVLVYQQPTPTYTTSTPVNIYSPTAAGAQGYISIQAMESPPQSVAEAMLLTSARQWGAEEGCYVISPLNNLDMTCNIANYTQPMYYANTPGDGGWWGASLGTQTLGSQTFVNYIPFNQNFMNFNQAGAIFSNLDPHSSLTVNVKWLVESFPTSGSVLQTLAKPSPEYDPMALELYSRISTKAPIGVMVKYNGLGDWFMDGIKSVGSAIAPLAKVVTPILGKNPIAKTAMSFLTGKPDKKKDKAETKVKK